MVLALPGRLPTLGQVVAEGKSRQVGVSLPGGAEPDGPVVGGGIETPRLVGTIEGAVASSPQQDVLTDAKHGQVDVLIAVDVERVGAGHPGEIACRGVQHLPESKGPANRALIAVEAARAVASGQIQVGPTVFVTVEHGHTAAHEVREIAVVYMVDTGTLRLIDEMGRR